MSTEQFTHDVFLSHSSKDKAVVRPLAERLRKDGLNVWLDEWEIKPGDSIPAKIEEGLECSRVLVLCMSAHAFGSDWAQLESSTFRFRDPLNEQRRFIPLRLDDAPIKGSLAQFLYINWRSADREQEYAKLLGACRNPQTWPKQSDETAMPTVRKARTVKSSDQPQPRRRQPGSPQSKRVITYAMLALGAFLCAMATVALLLWKADTLQALGLVGAFYYIVLLPLGLFVAAFLFGAMRSYAHYTGKQLSGTLELGGPIVGAALVVIGGFVLGTPQPGSFPLTVFVHGEGGKLDMVARNTGFVVIDLDGDRRREAIGDKGQAFFPAVPSLFREKPLPVSVDLPGFKPMGTGSYPLEGNSIYLPVRRLARSIRGYVQDDAGKKIQNAVVSSAGITANSDATGYFELSIPADRLKPEMPFQVEAAGYSTWRGTAVPGANDATVILQQLP